MQAVKDQVTLVRAMIELWRTDESLRKCVRLALVGDGPRHVTVA